MSEIETRLREDLRFEPQGIGLDPDHIIAVARRRHSRKIAAGASLFALTVLGLPTFVYLVADGDRSLRGADTGVAASEAGCRPVEVIEHQPGEHTKMGVDLNYDQSPPSGGRHWEVFLQGAQIKNFYTPADRPPVEQLVHSLEHGYRILWYDDAIAASPPDLERLRAIAAENPVGEKVMIAPWSKSDGAGFPDDSHIAFTFWSRADIHGPSATGITQYCTRISGEAFATFLKNNPVGHGVEPGAL